jgi:hypothetical protein
MGAVHSRSSKEPEISDARSSIRNLRNFLYSRPTFSSDERRSWCFYGYTKRNRNRTGNESSPEMSDTTYTSTSSAAHGTHFGVPPKSMHAGVESTVQLFEEMNSRRDENTVDDYDLSQSFAASIQDMKSGARRPSHVCTRDRSLARLVDMPVPKISDSM